MIEEVGDLGVGTDLVGQEEMEEEAAPGGGARGHTWNRGGTS